MAEQIIPTAAVAAEVPPRSAKTIYPEPYAARVAGREKRVLGDLLEIGDRTPGDSATWPDDDLMLMEIDGKRKLVHRGGTPY